MGGRLIFRGLHRCSPIRLYCHWSGKLVNTLGDLDKYLFTFLGRKVCTLSQFGVEGVVEFPGAGLGSRANSELNGDILTSIKF